MGNKIEKQQAKLMEIGLMEEDDTLVDFLQASFVERLVGKMGKWKQGWAYFTEKKLIVLTGILNSDIVIPYEKIRELGKCNQGFVPMGIVITYENGELIEDKVSMMKRDKWIHFMAEKAGIDA